MRTYCIAALVVVASAALAQERIDLTTPETTPSNAQYRIEKLLLDEGQSQIQLELRGQQGELVTCGYTSMTSPTGRTLLNALNKANLSTPYAGNATTGSLRQRIHHRLAIGPGLMGESVTVCDKPLVGTLAGTVP